MTPLYALQEVSFIQNCACPLPSLWILKVSIKANIIKIEKYYWNCKEKKIDLFLKRREKYKKIPCFWRVFCKQDTGKVFQSEKEIQVSFSTILNYLKSIYPAVKNANWGIFWHRIYFRDWCTECPKIYRKSVQHLPKYTQINS